MELFQQQRKSPVIQAFHIMEILHLFNRCTTMDSTTVRGSGAAAAWRGVLEVQVLGALGSTQASWQQHRADAAPCCRGCSVTLQLLLCCTLKHELCE